MSELQLVRALENFKPSQTRELYRRGDEHFIVSTVELGDVRDPAGMAIASMTETLAAVVGSDYDYPTSGEETMAFPADADGVQTSWTELAAAKGAGSRERVLEELRQ